MNKSSKILVFQFDKLILICLMMLENNQSMVNLSEKVREIVVYFWIMQRWKLKILKLLKMYVFGVFPQIYVAMIITSTKCNSFNN